MRRIYPVPEYIFSKYIPEYLSKQIKPMDVDVAYKYIESGIRMSDLARDQGLINFDVALPIEWVRHFEETTGFNPVAHFVYDYSFNNFGLPKPLTLEGKIAYEIYQHLISEEKQQ